MAQVSSLDYKITLPAEIAREYGQLQWKITLGKKPRGMWRPPLTIEFYHEKKGKENPLNIYPRWQAPCFRLPNWYENSCSESEALKNAPVVPFMIYTEPSCWDELSYSYVCCRCNLGIGGWTLNFFEERVERYYPEWRPGSADYSDVLEWFAQNICIPAVEEYNRRILEAYKSEPLEEVVFSSDDVEFRIRQKEEIKEKPFRKLRIK